MSIVICGHGKTVDAFKTSQKENAPAHLSTVRHFPRPSPVYTMCVPGLVTAVHRPVRPSSEVKMLPVAGWRLSGAGSGVVTVVTNNSTTAAAVAGI